MAPRMLGLNRKHHLADFGPQPKGITMQLRIGYELIYYFPQATRLSCFWIFTIHATPTLSCPLVSPPSLPYRFQGIATPSETGAFAFSRRRVGSA
jgi:hypothetical protein